MQFHFYGLIVGVAMVVAWELAQRKATQAHLALNEWKRMAVVCAMGGLLGARLHHAFTDWSIYSADVLSLVWIWNGGLSILGAVWGGTLAVIGYGYLRTQSEKISASAFFDTVVYGLPFGQMIGRLGNWVNQELYGLPSSLPGAVYIDPQHRAEPYLHIERYHPLFAYEMIALGFFGVWLWFFSKAKIGSRKPTIYYLFYYSIIRFLLEFLRIDKTHFFGTILSINQVFLVIVLVGLSLYSYIRHAQKFIH